MRATGMPPHLVHADRTRPDGRTLSRLCRADTDADENTFPMATLGRGHGDSPGLGSHRTSPPAWTELVRSPSADRERPLAGLEHRIDQSVLDRRLGGQDLVALDVAA